MNFERYSADGRDQRVGARVVLRNTGRFFRQIGAPGERGELRMRQRAENRILITAFACRESPISFRRLAASQTPGKG